MKNLKIIMTFDTTINTDDIVPEELQDMLQRDSYDDGRTSFGEELVEHAAEMIVKYAVFSVLYKKGLVSNANDEKINVTVRLEGNKETYGPNIFVEVGD